MTGATVAARRAGRERGHHAGAISTRGRAAGPLTTPADVGDVARDAAPGLCGAAPRAVFPGAHAGLGVLGQSAVPGVASRLCTTARADCPLARDTLQWLLDLGAATTHPVADNARVGEGLGELPARYTALYRCWMHRALKEATRLRPDRLDDGHFAALVRLSLRERDAPGLRRLYATA